MEVLTVTIRRVMRSFTARIMLSSQSTTPIRMPASSSTQTGGSKYLTRMPSETPMRDI